MTVQLQDDAKGTTAPSSNKVGVALEIHKLRSLGMKDTEIMACLNISRTEYYSSVHAEIFEQKSKAYEMRSHSTFMVCKNILEFDEETRHLLTVLTTLIGDPDISVKERRAAIQQYYDILVGQAKFQYELSGLSEPYY